MSESHRRHRSSRSKRSGGRDWTAVLAPPGQAWRLPLDGLLLALIVVAAFNYGATEAWSQQLVAALSTLICLYVAVACLFKPVGCQPVGSWTYFPIIGFVAIVLLQTVSLPAGLVQAIAPGIYQTRAELLADLGPPEASMPLSLLPAATLRQLWPLLPVIAVFIAALHAYRTESGVKRLAQIIAIAAASAVYLAFYEKLTGAGTQFGGAFEHPQSGPFLNHSHFGQFVNLGIGSALGLILIQISLAAKQYGRFPRIWQKLSTERAFIPFWIALVFVVAGAIAILLSFTRGGVISMLVAGGTIGLILTWGKSRVASADGVPGGNTTGRDKAALLLGLGLLIFTLSLAVGFDQIYDRLATLGNVGQTGGDGRLQILRDLAPAFSSYAFWGTGLGTFEFVFPKYDTDVRQSLTTHAENEYAQLMLETGLTGMLCIAVFLTLVLAAAFRVAWTPVRSLDYLSHGLAFGLVAILVHSLSDFGQHVPAVALMTALTCAAVLNLAALRRVRLAGDDGSKPLPSSKVASLEIAASDLGPRWLRRLGPALLIGLMVGSGYAVTALESSRKATTQYAAGLEIEGRIYGNNPDLVRPGDDERMIRR
ncbi:MAG: O-antigen ligase family protein, partial [Planctomycetota bacterium]